MKKAKSFGFLFLAVTLPLFSPGQTKLRIQHLTENFYVFTTWNSFQGTPFPANGLYAVTEAGAILIDSPWDTTQFQPLLDSIWIRHHKKVVFCLATHSHEDRTGGLGYFRDKGIPTYTSRMTDQISKERGEKRAEFLFSGDSVFAFGSFAFRCFYPGEGHTPDNLVIWFAKARVLYGGCLVKSTEAKNLGNLADANPKAWPESLEKVLTEFPDLRFVVPGHQSWADSRSIQHTLQLLKEFRK